MVCGSDKSAKMNINTSKSAVARGRRIRTLRMGLIPYTTPHYRDFSLSWLEPHGLNIENSALFFVQEPCEC